MTKKELVQKKMAESAYREQAREIWANYSNGEVEIDDDAKVNINDDGVWVQAWVWVRKEEVDDEQAEGK